MINRIPRNLQSDNGKEFKNGILQSYLRIINVNHIFQKPYQPQTNGIVERYNGIIKNKLINIFHRSTLNNFNLDRENQKIIKEHNSTKKSSTLYIPEEIRNIDDINIINQININIIKSMKRKIAPTDELLSEKTKLLLFNKIEKKGKRYIKKTFHKNGMYIIPCEFVGNVNCDKIKIKLEKS